MKQGRRIINGREYVLAGRAGSKESAQEEAKNIRARGRLARIIKIHDFDYMVYEF